MDFKISVPFFSLEDTLSCGQCFRWEKAENGAFRGIAGDRSLTVRQQGEELTFFDIGEEEFAAFWKGYFDLDGDYQTIFQRIRGDEFMEKAHRFCGGIHILRQDPWEALCSFIISQNNNIPRIKGIVARFCEYFGKKKDGFYAFPEPEVIASASLEELSSIRAGFRAKYLLDAAKKVSSGEVSLCSLETLPIEEGRKQLQSILGVGPKVAECVLLYGCHKVEAFPIDTWIKKVMDRYYPQGLPEQVKPYGGIAQQYLFHAVRNGIL